MAKLCVNIDHVATVRQARRTIEPDPVYAAVIAELCPGVAGITLHVRQDRRHAQDRDLLTLRQLIKIKLNLELAPVAAMLELAAATRPTQGTLVPERREEVTTEGGLDVAGQEALIRNAVARLQAAGLIVSLFIDPRSEQIKAARQTGAEAVELNTAAYAESATAEEQRRSRDLLAEAVRMANREGLIVHAGHGLTYRNVSAVAALPGIDELNIGHSIVARSIFVGFERAVTEMVQLIERAFPAEPTIA